MKLTFGEKLLILRRRHGLPIKALVIDWGISRKVIENYERDRATPPADIVAMIASFYGVSADWLLGLKESMV